MVLAIAADDPRVVGRPVGPVARLTVRLPCLGRADLGLVVVVVKDLILLYLHEPMATRVVASPARLRG